MELGQWLTHVLTFHSSVHSHRTHRQFVNPLSSPRTTNNLTFLHFALNSRIPHLPLPTRHRRPRSPQRLRIPSLDRRTPPAQQTRPQRRRHAPIRHSRVSKVNFPQSRLANHQRSQPAAVFGRLFLAPQRRREIGTGTLAPCERTNGSACGV